MPHDRKGQELRAGDRVLIPATVTSVWPSDDYCNATLSIGGDEPHGPHNVQSSVTLNTRQVEKVEQ